MNFNGKYNVAGQILLWLSIWLLMTFVLTNAWEHPYRFWRRLPGDLLGISLIVILNIKLLLPRFYFRKQMVVFILAGVGVIMGIVWLMHSDWLPWSYLFDSHHNPLKGLVENGNIKLKRKIPPGFNWMRYMTPLSFAFLGSTLVEVIRYANQKEKQAVTADKEKFETELKFLRSQINPHFLFNVLNNIYTLSVIKSDKTPESLLHLSELLRYMLYDSNEGKVALQKEINYLNHYVELQLLKDSRGMDVQLDIEASRSDVLVAPMLFIPFVENAFKHSKIEDLENGKISISLSTTESALYFTVDNTVPARQFTKDKVGGIGLENTRKRLDLLYPDQHELIIQQTDGWYKVNLTLQI